MAGPDGPVTFDPKEAVVWAAPWRLVGAGAARVAAVGGAGAVMIMWTTSSGSKARGMLRVGTEHLFAAACT